MPRIALLLMVVVTLQPLLNLLALSLTEPSRVAGFSGLAVIPDGFSKGDPFILSRYQTWYFANFYRVKPDAPELDEWIELLHDQALIAEGSPVDDPAKVARRMTKLLSTAAQRAVEG